MTKPVLTALTAFFATAVFFGWTYSGDDPISLAKKELEPRPFVTADREQKLSAILESLLKQTGNLVVDRRTSKSDPKIVLESSRSSFWQVLDAAVRKAGCAVSIYQPEGSIALVDGRPSSARTDYTGIFRVSAKRVAVSQDLESGVHTCIVALDVAWEPRFQPFYVEVGPVEAIYASPANEKPRVERTLSSGQTPVAGRAAAEMEVRLPAPPRKFQTIESLKGTLRVIGPSKMLDFTFDKLRSIKKGDEPRSEMQNGVKVTLTGLRTGAERWSIDVLIENPTGGVKFESFQTSTWLDNNRIALVRGNEKWVPEPDAEEPLAALTAARAHIRYHFQVKDRKSSLADWTLQYRTPGRIVELTAPFVIRDLLLP
ncbi:MAG: hypothetical protein HY040_02000 [Planctomycetes bacterium]|nr:hypothetical protein [Planctomycetota bacterium]